MFFLSPDDISTVMGEAKKYKIQINESDISNYDKKASQLFKKKSITEDIVQNLVDDPDSFDEDSDFEDQDLSLDMNQKLTEDEEKKFRKKITKKIINKIVDDRLKHKIDDELNSGNKLIGN